MIALLKFLVGPVGRWLVAAFVGLSALTGLYVKGRVDGKAAYQAKLTREINKAITKGDAARTDALKKFDENKEIEDADGFSRD